MSNARLYASIGAAIVAILMVVPGGAGGPSHHLVQAGHIGLRADAVAPRAFHGMVTIGPLGSITPSGAPIVESGLTYTLTASMWGSITDDRNGSTLNGAGYTLNYTAFTGPGEAIYLHNTNGITVEGLTITNETGQAILVSYSQHTTITSSKVSGTGYGAYGLHADWLNISGNQFPRTAGAFLYYGSHVLVAQNDLSHSTASAVSSYAVSGISIVRNNLSFGAQAEVSLYSTTDVLVSGNTVYNAGATPDAVYGSQIVNATFVWNNGSNGDYVFDLEYAARILVDHNSVPNARYGTYLYDVSDVTIADNAFPYAFYEGIDASSIRNYAFTNNQLTHSNSEGIYAYLASNGIIEKNNVSYFYSDGIDVEYSGNVSIVGNQASYTTVPASGTGFYTYEDGQLTLANNTAVYDYEGWYEDYSNGVTATADNFSHGLSGGYGAYVGYDNQVTIERSDLSHSSGEGLYVYETSQSLVSQNDLSYAGINALDVEYDQGLVVASNDLSHSPTGVYSTYVSNGLLTHNSANASGRYGFWLTESNGLVASGNWAWATAFDAFYVYYSTGVTFADNHASRSPNALQVDNTIGFVASGNNLSSSRYGLNLTISTGVSIYDNTFWNDTGSFWERGSSGVLFHNNFLRDRGWNLNPTEVNAGFHWDSGYPVGGNHWDNYTGTDTKSGPGQNLTGSDGIGDTPFLLNPLNVDHYPLMQGWSVHSVTFTETGLPTGRSWSVALNGETLSSTSASLAFAEPNGASIPYSYSVAAVPGYVASPSTGGGVEAQSDLVVNLVFTAVTYAVTFTETGLSAGTAWSVTVNGHVVTGSSPSLSIGVPNGTFGYVVGIPADYSSAHGNGSVTVSGATQTVTVAFSAVLFNVTFSETGLPSGATWSVSLNGVSKSATTSTITFAEPDGTYSFSLGSVSGYTAALASGPVKVHGGSVLVPVSFASALSALTTGTSGALFAGLVVALIVAAAGWILALRFRKKPPPPLVPASIPTAPTSTGPGGNPPSGGASAPPPPGGPPWKE